jgi:hypothetical protein
MTTSPEAPELIQYSCERCKTRFVLPPSSQRLGVTGMLRAFFMGIGRSLKTHQGLGVGFGAARRELMSKMDDDAYQAFVLSFRFCHECRQFVCNDCWSKSRGTCLTCAAKATTSPARIKPIVTAAAAVPDIPRPIVTRAPQRRGRTRRDFGLVGLALAIVLISIEGGVLLLNATSGPSDVSAGQTQNHSLTPGSSALRQWIVTPPPNTPGGVSASSSSGPYATDNPTGTLAPGETPHPGTTRRPGSTGNPGPTAPPTPAPTPAPGHLIITASSGSMTYGGTVPTIDPQYAGLTGGDTAPTTPPTCSTAATSSSSVSGGPYTSSCTGAVDSKYIITYVTGLVTVDPALMTITASSPSITYGDATPGITPFYAPNVVPSVVPTCDVPSYSPGAAAGGSYITSCSGASDPNYTISYVAGSVGVARRTIHVTCTATPNPITAGDPVPSYGYQITSGSFYGSDTWLVPPGCTSTYQTTDTTETIPISISGATADATNYSVTPSDGTLVVQ